MDWEKLKEILSSATPGPWKDPVDSDDYSVDRHEDGWDGLTWSGVGPGNNKPVALVVVPSSFGMDDIQAANSALIAKAPALGELALAGKAVVDAVNGKPGPSLEEAMRAWDALQ